MSGKHAYGSDTRNRLTTLGYIALTALVITIVGLALLRGLFETPSLKQFKPYTWPVSPITLTSVFGFVYLGYENFLWKKLSKTPNLTGTWIGLALPNYQTNFPHMEIVTIDQSWSEISINGDAFFKVEKDDEWNLEKKLGRNKSTAAGMTNITASQADVTICYGHSGRRYNQPDFEGTWNFVYYHLEKKLDGKYYTNRMARTNDKQGSLGPAIFLRVSHEIITPTVALEEGKEMLKTLENQIMHRAT
jgi:hypothetical protein